MVWFGGRAIHFVDKWKLRGAFGNTCLKKQSLFSQFCMVTEITVHFLKSPSNNKDFRDATTVQHNTGFMSVQQLMKSQLWNHKASTSQPLYACIMWTYFIFQHVFHIAEKNQTQHDISSPWCNESWYQHANKLWQYTTLNYIRGHYTTMCVWNCVL